MPISADVSATLDPALSRTRWRQAATGCRVGDGGTLTRLPAGLGWLYVAFIVDVFARRIVGWRVSSSMRTGFVLDALEQALYARQPERDSALVHHTYRGSRYVSIRYSERLAEAGIEPSVGSKGDSNALAKTINGLYKAELIHRRAPWKTKESVEPATLEWVARFNNHRLLEPIGYIPPA